MKFIIRVSNKEMINAAFSLPVKELCFGPKELDRFSSFDMKEVILLTKQCKLLGIPCSLQWDILMTENKFQKCIKFLEQNELISYFDNIRVQDVGAFYYIKQNYPDHKIQLILETGNVNLTGIKSYEEFAPEQLNKLVLSTQIPLDSLIEFKKRLKSNIEIFGFGPLLIYYSPRRILSQMNGINSNFVFGTSEESVHKNFPILENENGTFMFHPRFFSLFEYLEPLNQLDIDFRIDLPPFNFKNINSQDLFKDFDSFLHPFTIEKYKSFCQQKAISPMKGLFQTNRSNVMFPKLRNPSQHKETDNYLGEVLENNRDNYCAIFISNPKMKVAIGDQLNIKTPVGKSIQVSPHWFKNAVGEKITEIRAFQLALLPFVKGVLPQSKIYLSH